MLCAGVARVRVWVPQRRGAGGASSPWWGVAWKVSCATAGVLAEAVGVPAEVGTCPCVDWHPKAVVFCSTPFLKLQGAAGGIAVACSGVMRRQPATGQAGACVSGGVIVLWLCCMQHAIRPVNVVLETTEG
jgi:hypothetical protein